MEKTATKGISPWGLASASAFSHIETEVLFEKKIQDYSFKVQQGTDSLWLIVGKSRGGRKAFRLAFAPSGIIELEKVTEKDDGVEFALKSIQGSCYVNLVFPENELPFFRYTVTLRPKTPLFIPFWPRDIILLSKEGNGLFPEGKVYAKQEGLRTGLLYLSMTKPKTGTLFYFQNLSALSEYCELTKTSLSDTVGGEWPEMGFALPATKEIPLPARKQVVINDAFVLLSPDIPRDELEMARQFLDMLAQVYLHLPLPETNYPDWPAIAEKSLHDLENCPGCWSYVNGKAYLNAYLADYDSPPESMVQLAVLLPLMEYALWKDEKLPIVKKIEECLPSFYDDKINSLARWLPEKEVELDGSEEHKKPRVMDSWYMLHPLLNLSRIALNGSKTAEKLFLNSLDYTIKVAHHFDYKWPVFYDLDSLETIKEESKPGKGGEQDVAGFYAHVMLQAYELTGEKRYLNEAKKAAQSLQGYGFDLMYQANNTAFSTGAMLRLWKLTGDDLYLNLSYLCVANLYKNMWLWEGKYGHGKKHPTFFALFPLQDAPYTAVYEEQEGFAAFNDYLAQARDEQILPSVSLLLSEFIRNMTYKGMFYFPPMLPKDMLAKECRTGELDPGLWIPIEDMHDGWEECGEVGQEVYGAGLAFGILTRQFFKVPGEPWMIFIDYPTSGKELKKGKPISFNIWGDRRLTCRLRLIPTKGKLQQSFQIAGEEQEYEGKKTKEGHLEFIIHGNQKIIIRKITGQKGKK